MSWRKTSADVTETFDAAVQGAMAVGDVTVKNGQLTHGETRRKMTHGEFSTLSGWWFGTFSIFPYPYISIYIYIYIYIYYMYILGISSSQLTFTPSFFRGVGLNHQPVSIYICIRIYTYIYIIYINITMVNHHFSWENHLLFFLANKNSGFNHAKSPNEGPPDWVKGWFCDQFFLGSCDLVNPSFKPQRCREL